MNSHQRDQYWKKLILSSIYDDDGLDTIQQRIDHIQRMYSETFDYERNRRRYPNPQVRVANWLMGLPLNLPVYNGEIRERLIVTGVIHEKSSESTVDRHLANYWSVMAAKLIQLWDGHHIPKNLDI